MNCKTIHFQCFQLYDIAKAKEDHSERCAKAENIKADIAKTLDAVNEANNVLQVKGIKYFIVDMFIVKLKSTL